MDNISFISKKYQELIDGSETVIILRPKDYSRFDIELFNTMYKDARAFQVIYNEEPIIFIKKVKYIKDLNYRELSRVADVAFAKHDTNNAIKLYETLLLIKKPGVHVYARLGILYLSQNNMYRALTYLKIATAYSGYTKKNKYNFTYLVNKITKTKEKNEEEKAIVSMSVQDFSNDLNNYYGYSKVRDVGILIDFHGMSIDEACQCLNINEEDKKMITLLLARDCYARGEFQLGDEYIKIVEKTENKSKQVKKLIEELRRNRLFYQNRVDETYKPLSRARTLN